MSGDMKLMGYTSLWSFLSYGIAITVFGESIRNFFISRDIPFLLRCILSVPCSYAIEFFFGLVFTAMNVCPWDYSEFEYNFMGLITLEYAPFWFAAGLYVDVLLGMLNSLEVMPVWKLSTKKTN